MFCQHDAAQGLPLGVQSDLIPMLAKGEDQVE